MVVLVTCINGEDLFENQFIKGFCLGAIENRKGHSEKLANAHRLRLSDTSTY